MLSTPMQFLAASQFAKSRSVNRTDSCSPAPVKTTSSSDRTDQRRTGLTLIEIMIALTMTLVVLGAMAQAFSYVSGEIQSGRAVVEMSNRLRNAQQLLRSDLAGITVDVRPHATSQPNGYFEYIEGPENDSGIIIMAEKDGYIGDVDDYIAFTCRNLRGDFRGSFNGQILKAPYAEVAWFTHPVDQNNDGTLDLDGNGVLDFNETNVLNRRVLLIRPDLNGTLTNSDGDQVRGLQLVNTPAEAQMFIQQNDISVGVVELPTAELLIFANSLQSLGRRENRFGRVRGMLPIAGPFPHTVNVVDSLLNTKKSGDFSGDEILLSDVAAFDVQIYAPSNAKELVDIDGDGTNETAIAPHDVGFAATNSANGGFVDLGFSGIAFNLGAAPFTTAATAKSNLARTYCTWSPHYEVDGIDTDGFGGVDQGLNGLDDDGVNGVDDEVEKETAPPYPFAPRGIKVTLRIIEKNTKQVRQSSVVHNFLKF